jgi:hypothetical protein
MPTFTSLGSQYLVSSTPWPYTKERNRDWYTPYMMAPFAESYTWYNIVRFIIDMSQVHAENAWFTERIPAQPDITEQALRGLTLPRQYFDSRRFGVTYSSYGGSVQYHKYDNMIYQWAQINANNPQVRNTGIPQTDLIPIIRGDLAENMTKTLNILARNAILANGYGRTFASDATGFHNLAAEDTFNPDIARAIRLNSGYMPQPGRDVIPAVTSPAATYTVTGLPATDNYMRFREATQDKMLLNYVVGDYMGITWMEDRALVLYNCGAVLASASITSAVEPGDGAPDPATTGVDDHWRTGSEDATHYIQLSSISDPSTAETGFKQGDIVTLCRTKATANAAMATSGGVVWNDPDNITVRLASVDYNNNRVSLEIPVLNEKYFTAISSGLYGYVIKGRPVHACVFFNRGLADPGIASVVMDSPKMYIVPPIDDRQARWVFSWDTYMKYNLVDPAAFNVHFFAGPITRVGANGLETLNL